MTHQEEGEVTDTAGAAGEKIEIPQHFYRDLLVSESTTRLVGVLTALVDFVYDARGFILHLFDTESGLFFCKGIRLPEEYRGMEFTFEHIQIPFDSDEPIAEVFRTGKPLLVTEEIRKERPYTFGARLINWSTGRTVLLPLAYDGKIIGVFSMFAKSEKVCSFETEEVLRDWLEIFARQYERIMHLGESGSLATLSHTAEQRRFVDFVVMLNELQEPEDLFRQFGLELMHRYPFNLFAVLLPEENDLPIKHVLSNHERFFPVVENLMEWGENNPYSLEKGDGASALAYLQKHSFHFSDVQEILHIPMTNKDRSGLEVLQSVRTFLIVPILYHDTAVGVMWLLSLEAPIALADQDVHLIEAMCGFLATAMNNSAQFLHVDHQRQVATNLNLSLQSRVKELDAHAVRDHLTGLYNLRFFEQRMELFLEQINESDSVGKGLSLIIFDIDHFKLFNDTFGHNIGNLVLKQVSERLSNFIRAVDIACRYGGEEFVIILPGCGLDAAKKIAEGIRADVENLPPIKNTQSITISLGCATYQRGESITQFFERTDAAMYKAKEAGRNCVRTA
jgi:two-component system cell cycle response regulator